MMAVLVSNIVHKQIIGHEVQGLVLEVYHTTYISILQTLSLSTTPSKTLLA